VPLPVNPLTVPFATVTSVSINPVTVSLKVAVTVNKPLTVAAEVDAKVTVGGTASITMALLPPRELAVAKAGRVKSAFVAKLSLIVPPLRVRAVVERYSKSAEVSPAWTT